MVAAALSNTARIAALRVCHMFEGLRPPDLERIAEFAILRKLLKGEFLFHEGEPTRGFFIVRSGAINVHRIGPDGREHSIHVFRAGESLAEATLADGVGYPAHACAVESSVVVYVPRDEFLELLKQRPDLSLRMLSSMSQHLRALVNSLDDMCRKDIETRLAHWLLKRCPWPLQDTPADVRLDVSKTVLAAELHVRNETLSRTLNRLSGLGLIDSRGRTVRVFSPQKLEAVIQMRPGAQAD
jgi:CRP/FNR family transcriptional regulator